MSLNTFWIETIDIPYTLHTVKLLPSNHHVMPFSLTIVFSRNALIHIKVCVNHEMRYFTLVVSFQTLSDKKGDPELKPLTFLIRSLHTIKLLQSNQHGMPFSLTIVFSRKALICIKVYVDHEMRYFTLVISFQTLSDKKGDRISTSPTKLGF